MSDYGPVIHAASSLEGPSNTSAAEPTMMLEGGAPLLALGGDPACVTPLVRVVSSGPGVDSAVVANAVTEAKEDARARVSKAMADPESE